MAAPDEGGCGGGGGGGRAAGTTAPPSKDPPADGLERVRKWPVTRAPPVPLTVAGGSSPEAHRLLQTTTRTDFVQRPAAVKFEIVFEISEVILSIMPSPTIYNSGSVMLRSRRHRHRRGPLLFQCANKGDASVASCGGRGSSSAHRVGGRRDHMLGTVALAHLGVQHLAEGTP